MSPALLNPSNRIRDRDSVFSAAADRTFAALSFDVLNTPIRAPPANALCERLIGTIRRDCLDHLIPISEGYLRFVPREWSQHRNRGRPHFSLRPEIQDAHDDLPAPPATHRLPRGGGFVSTSLLGWLHHEYRFEEIAA